MDEKQQDYYSRAVHIHFLQLGLSIHLTGNVSLKVVPFPGSLSTSISPRCSDTICFTRESPIPNLCCFVLKKGSNILSSSSFGMPGPVSETSMTTLSLSP